MYICIQNIYNNEYNVYAKDQSHTCHGLFKLIFNSTDVDIMYRNCQCSLGVCLHRAVVCLVLERVANTFMDYDSTSYLI